MKSQRSLANRYSIWFYDRSISNKLLSMTKLGYRDFKDDNMTKIGKINLVIFFFTYVQMNTYYLKSIFSPNDYFPFDKYEDKLFKYIENILPIKRIFKSTSFYDYLNEQNTFYQAVIKNNFIGDVDLKKTSNINALYNSFYSKSLENNVKDEKTKKINQVEYKVEVLRTIIKVNTKLEALFKSLTRDGFLI